jgi:subtilase family serine protease
MGCYEFGFMDLTITSIVTIPEVPSPGEIVSVEVTVINQGSDGVGPFQIDWYADSVFPPLPQISGTESEIVYSLGAGNSYTMVKNHKYNMSGGYSMYAQVDTMKQVSETDESNNVFGSQIIMVAQNANVNITIKLPLSEDLDPYSSIPLTVRFFTPDSDVLSDTPLADYNLTAVVTGDTATVNINDLAEGNYDVTVSSEHTLINVKRNVAVSLPSTSVNMGTLLEGNANNDFGIDCGDLSLLADSWLLTEEARGFNQMADFDRNRLIDNNDFALLAGNWWKTSPVEIP